MTNTIHWNTGCQYTAKGQRITATLKENNVVTFCDHDRMVTGEFLLCGDFTSVAVMQAYLHNIAQQTQQSWADGFMADGCNAEYKGK